LLLKKKKKYIIYLSLQGQALEVSVLYIAASQEVQLVAVTSQPLHLKLQG
jgi:hypothetical protein